MKTLVLLFTILLWGRCLSQDTTGLAFSSIDTIQLEIFASKKVVVYKYHQVSFLLDYSLVHAELIKLSKESYWVSTVKEQLAKVTVEIQKGDTAYLDQQTFDKINWVPFDNFLCNQLEIRNCLIMDIENKIYKSIIRIDGVRKSGKYFAWGGFLYFLPGDKNFFKECTKWES